MKKKMADALSKKKKITRQECGQSFPLKIFRFKYAHCSTFSSLLPENSHHSCVMYYVQLRQKVKRGHFFFS